MFADSLVGDESNDDDDNDHPIVHKEDTYTSEGDNSNTTSLEGADEADGAIEGVGIEAPPADDAIEGVGVEAPPPIQQLYNASGRPMCINR